MEMKLNDKKKSNETRTNKFKRKVNFVGKCNIMHNAI